MRLRIARYLTAAALAAAVSFPGQADAQDKPRGDSQRFPAGPANMFRPGAALTFYANTSDPALVEGLTTAMNIITAQSQQNALMVAAARSKIAAGVETSDKDALARAAVDSIDGTFSVLVQAGFVRAMAQTNPTFATLLQTARIVVPLPGDGTIRVPVLMAAAVHSTSMIAVGEKMRAGEVGRSLQGAYDLTVLGECALTDGKITITQTDFVFEGARGENLAFYGTVGESKAYLVANERRYAKVTDTGTNVPTIEVPDRPSDIFEASLPDPGGAFAFRSIKRGDCAAKLTPED